MAAEYSGNAVQTVASNQPVIFTESPVPCNRGLIFHRDESGSFLLSSLVRGNQGCICNPQLYETRYSVIFHGNIAVPTGGTAEEIQLAVSVDGETDPSSTMIFTPAEVEEFGNVSAAIIVSVPSICGCDSVSVRNISTQDILVQNANIIFDLVGVQRTR